jgi:hypothetical protein
MRVLELQRTVCMAAKALDILAEFKDKQLEADFGRWSLPGNRPSVYFGVTLLSVLWLLFIPNDYRLHGLTPTFYYLLSLRMWQIALGGAVCYLVRKSDNEQLYQYIISFFWLSTLMAIFIVNTTRPAAYFINFFIDIMALLICYIIPPNRLIFQFVPALLFTAISQDYLLSNKYYQDNSELRLVVMSLVVVNVVGIILSWRINLERRNRYSVLMDLWNTNKKLEKALSEIKTLQGIVPICAKCKKIRDDKGYWKQLEEYMGTHLDAEFSHGLCPDCMRELYPEVAEKVLERQTKNIGPKH